MAARIRQRLESLSLSAVFGVVLTLTATIGLLDFLSGGEYSLSVFYLIPVSFAAWFGDRRLALFAAALAGVAWLIEEKAAHLPFSNPHTPYWNAPTRTIFFLIAVGWLRTLRRNRARLNAEVERKTAELREEVAHRRDLERDVAQVTAREQARIARDLHDGVGQYLAGLSFHARILADDLKKEGSPHATDANRLVEQINLTNRQTRRLDTILSPPVGEAGGLPEALRQLVYQIELFSDVHCQFEAAVSAATLNEFQRLNLFRIAQEALNNAIKHGEAKTVRLELTMIPEGLRLRVSDRGRGLPLNMPTDEGAGLRIMRHRAELIGATFDVRTGNGRGCVVECLLPLPAPLTEPANET